VKMFDAGKTSMIGLPSGENDDMLSRFNLVTDRQTDGQTDLLYQYRTSVC